MLLTDGTTLQRVKTQAWVASLTGTRESSSPCAIESGTVIFSASFNGDGDALEERSDFCVALIAVLTIIEDGIQKSIHLAF
jgi:hypothetical protein